MSTLSLVLAVLAAGVLLLQVLMVVGWAAAIKAGASASVPFWPLAVAVALALGAVLTR